MNNFIFNDVLSLFENFTSTWVKHFFLDYLPSFGGPVNTYLWVVVWRPLIQVNVCKSFKRYKNSKVSKKQTLIRLKIALQKLQMFTIKNSLYFSYNAYGHFIEKFLTLCNSLIDESNLHNFGMHSSIR